MNRILLLFILLAINPLLSAQIGLGPTTKWEFVKGDSTVPSGAAVYGKLGLASEGNKPIARTGAITWVDASGVLWLFGGTKVESPWHMYNDLWKFDPANNQWTFVKGDITPNATGSYGVRGIPADANKPGSRYGSVSWIDGSGNLWLFGGIGYFSSEGYFAYAAGPLNELWKYNPSTNQWTWMKGDNCINAKGVYGTRGVTASTNNPGGRLGGSGWKDASGNFWLFGGAGYTIISGSAHFPMNDLWKYDLATNNWTWIKGDSLGIGKPTFGTMGIASPNNTPGGKTGSGSWTDDAGNFWLYGGYEHRYDTSTHTEVSGASSDLWKYNPSTSQWTWMHGDTIFSRVGRYGTLGVFSALNKPGARSSMYTGKDATGNLLLFAGSGDSLNIKFGPRSDLWKYNISTNEWAWIKGDTIINVTSAVFGTLRVENALNKLPAQDGGCSWTTASGFWSFGGKGSTYNYFNALWKYNPSSNQWAWMKGDSTKNAFSIPAIFGEQGLSSEGNNPGVRNGHMMWKDAIGNLWLFGGDSDTTTGVNGFKNDLWKYTIATGQWTWMKGDSTLENVGVYGSMGVPAANNKPGARHSSSTWIDASGNLWLFGGYGYHATTFGVLNDLWKYDPTTNNWTWMKGDNTGQVTGVYGIQGTAAPTNKPGSRLATVSWIDATGKFWLHGGSGYGTTTTYGYLNDLWRYDPATNNWTWFKGDNSINNTGVYGTIGIAAAGNKPGARNYSQSWSDASGNLWLFGGNGYHTTTTLSYLNDLWRYNIAANAWTWMKGNNTGNNLGVYGTPGIEAAGNKPGSRLASAAWQDASGNFLLFGGYGYAESSEGSLNDLWKYNPTTNNWSYLNGSNEPNQLPEFGAREFPSNLVHPGATQYSSACPDGAGNTYLFGGGGSTACGPGLLNLLFKYNSATNEWTWLKGIKCSSQQGVFGSQGIANYANKPGARANAASWIDTSGNLWLFGGQDHKLYRSDLWKFDRNAREWTFMKGDSLKNIFTGTYGTIGVPSNSNQPGARKGSASWADSLGNIWLFGGMYTISNTDNYQNDLWKYNTGTGQWIWVKGNNTNNNFGVYGSQGVAAPGNQPGARDGSLSWIDTSGIMWLFGGYGYAASGSPGYLNDLWKFDPLTNNWTWVKGSNTINAVAVYGSQYVPAPSNTPGARRYSTGWVDTTQAGRPWLFGGIGYAGAGSPGQLNDLWMFDPVSNQWTWRDGNNSTNTSGVYTGTAVPGAREGSVSWIDAYGQMWLFSGKGYDKFGALGDLNDLWKYDPNSYAWTHVKGQQTINAFGLVDQPGARRYAVPWIDANNNFYVFGGYGKGTTGTGYLNDLWKIFAGTTYIFIGNGSWFDASNWYNFFAPPSTLLTAGWNVIIDHQIPGDCILAGNLSIMGGGRVKIESQKQLTIDQGDLVNEGELVGVGNLPGKVIFTGVNNNGLISSGTISTPLILQDKKMFLTGNTSTVSINLLGSAGRLSTPDAVGSSLTLGEYNLYMDTASLFTNNSNYIITNGTGRLVRTVGTGSSVLFPIGIDQNSYTPATILNNGIADDFEVAVKTGVFTRADSGTAITSEHVNRSWFIQKGISANNNATITLQWNTGEEQVGFLRQQSYISHFNSCPPPDPCTIGYWDDAVLSSAVANGTSYMQLRNFTQPINSYPFFTVKSRIEYIFVNATGDGNWSNVNNWMYQRKPPVDINDPTRTIIGPGMQVSIEQNCQFTGQLLTQPGGSIMIKEGKRLNIHQ